MSYHVEGRRSAERELGRVSAQARQRIASAWLRLAEEPLPPSVKKLKGSDGYRIRCTIDTQRAEVSVFAIGQRKEVYH